MNKILLLLLALSSGAVYAQTPPPATVDSWLALQRDGTYASQLIQSATAAERERSAQRWLKTFEQDIPAQLLEEKIGSDR